MGELEMQGGPKSTRAARARSAFLTPNSAPRERERLCDKEVDGCDQPRFQPYNIRGWFWASTLQGMGDTNVFDGRKFNAWSHTGRIGKAQPDGILKADGFGEQACAAVVDNKFQDGLTWHDTKCNDRRHIVCEDLPVGNINFVRQQNPEVT